MAPFPDHDETQAVDSPQPDDLIPIDETQPVDLSTEDYSLYGETQALEEEEEVVHNINAWMKTQALDMDDGIQEGEVSEEKDTILTDSDASTYSGGSVRSFTAVRTASLRSSGLAAARSSTPMAVVVEPKSSFGNSENCKSQDNDVDGLPVGKSSGMETPKCTAHLIDISKDIDIEDPHESMQKDHRDERKSRTHNPRVKKLLYEHTSPVDDETMIKLDSLTGKLDSLCSLGPDCAVAGLSYIHSQEPGVLSQANALDIVDNFISVHDLGLSQETNTGKTDMVKSLPISSAKGAQILAKSVDHRSPVEKTGTFEWIDSQEDEGGGEFFSRRKESFFECKVAAQKLHSEPPKSKQFRSSLARETVHKSGKKPSKIPNRQTTLTHSDSRLIQQRSFRNKRVHVSKTRTKKNLFEDLNKQTNSPSLEQQAEVNDNGRDGEGTYEVGPDTQIAAEAMEALIHGTNYDKNDVNEIAGTSICSEGVAMKKTSSKRSSLRNSTSSTPKTEGVSTRAKRRLLPTKSRTESPRFSRCKSQKGNRLDCIAGKMKEKRENEKPGQLLNGSSVDNIGSSASIKGRKQARLLKETISKEVDKCRTSLTLNVQLSVSKENTLCEFHVSSTPVAHRTRHAKAVKSSNQAEALVSGSGKNTIGLTGVRTCRAIAREEGKISADVSRTLTMKRKSTDIKSDEYAIIERLKPNGLERLHDEEPKSSSLVKDVPTHPKRRRTCKITSENQKVKGDMNNPSLSPDSIQLRIQHGQIKGTIKSVSEILDTAKRKKRSVFINRACEFDDMASDGEKVTFKSTVERASPKSVSTKPTLDDCSNECLATSILYKSDSFGAANPCSTPLKQVEDVVSRVENEGDNAKLDGSLRVGLHPSDQTCTTPSKDTYAVSPVCVAQNYLRVSGNRGRSRSSITRELIRLEACDASPNGTFNTRRRKDMASVHVLFSHHLDGDIIKQQKKIMGRLGVALASSMSDATHFVTDKFVRTRNMLEAMSMGKPVVTYMWLESCGQTNCFIDEKNYILRDAKKEKEIGFSMPVSLARAYRSPLLQDKRVYITPNTKPDLELLSSLVKSAHGQSLERIGTSALNDDKLPDDLLVISCEEDYAICIPLLEKGAEIYSSELLLNGIVIQKLEYERHVLFLDHVRRTRSTLWLRQKDGNQFLPVSRYPAGV